MTGASGGIGLEITRRLLKGGASVFAQYHQQAAPLEALTQHFGAALTPKQTNLAKPEEVSQLASEVTARGLHILINNAGIIRDNLLASAELDEFHELLQINYLAAVSLCKAAVRPMLRQRYGRIINITSVAAHLPGRGQSNYAATKGALTSFSKALAVELGPKGITVNCVAPGVIETKMSEPIRQLAGEEILAKTALQRFGTAQEVAASVCFLASEEAGFITGQTLQVDGGFKLR